MPVAVRSYVKRTCAAPARLLTCRIVASQPEPSCSEHGYEGQMWAGTMTLRPTALCNVSGGGGAASRGVEALLEARARFRPATWLAQSAGRRRRLEQGSN